MATTKIWDVSAHVSKLLAYVANKKKTTIEMENKNVDEAEQLAAEILGLPPEHFATEEKKFVTGINCTPENAKSERMTRNIKTPLTECLKNWKQKSLITSP